MGRIICRKVFGAAIVILFWSASSTAGVVEIDRFELDKNGASLFTDTFSNNLTPSQEAGYGVIGIFPNGAESGGRLTLDSDWGALTFNAQGDARQTLLVTRQTPNNASGLTSSDTIDISGIFDLATPLGPLTNGYGVRVIEAGQAQVSRLVELDVQYNANFGGDVVRYLLQDFVAGTITTLGFVAWLPPPGADQIELSISRPDTANGNFFGAYAFGTGGVFGPLTAFSTPGELFTSTDFVRGQFIDFTAVPEPVTLALVALGFAGLGFARRKQ